MATNKTDRIRMVDPVLSTIARGYTNETFIADKLFPEVSVSKLKGKIPAFGKDAFYLRDTARGIGSGSNRIPAKDIELIDFATQEQDVEMAIDYIDAEESENLQRYEAAVVKQLKDSILLSREKSAADLAQNENNYPAGMVTTITGAEAFDDYTLTIDPVAIIKDGIDAIRAKIGRFPNTMVIGGAAYRALSDHPKLLDRMEFTGVTKITEKILSELFNIKNVHIGLAVYTSDGSTFTDVWSDNIVLAYVDDRTREKRTEYNPSYGYTFQRSGKPEVDIYYENGGKIKVIRNTDNYSINITGSDAAYLIKNTNHN